MIEIRPATLADILAYSGNLPFTRARAWVGVEDGKVLGVGGLAYLDNGAVIAFMDIDDTVRKSAKVSICKAARTAIRWAISNGLTEINALKADDVPAAERFLMRLGFLSVGNGVYSLRGG